MKKEKLVEKFKDLSLAEFDELITHFNSKKEENEKTEIEKTEVPKEESGTTDEKEKVALPENVVTKEELAELNTKIEKYETILQELMKDKPVGVQRKVVNKVKEDVTDGDKYYDTSNYLQALKRRK